MKKREVKKQIKNNIFKLELTDEAIDDIYLSLPKIIKVCNKKNIVELYYNNEKIDIDYINNNTDKKVIDIIETIHAINLKDTKEKFNYIYEAVCAKLDERIKTNYCEFKDNICVKYRKKGSNHENGCCECKGRGKCKYLIDGVCTMSCMACKLFTCHTLKTMGITQNINDFVLTKYFLTTKQKDILQFSYWTPKEIVMEKLMKTIRKRI